MLAPAPSRLRPGEIAMLADLVRTRLKKIAVDANLHDRYGAEYPSAVKASKERKKLLTLLAKLGNEMAPHKM